MPSLPSQATEAARQATSWWQDLKAALRGTAADYTVIPLPRAVFLLSVPMLLELVLESAFAVVDIWFVARLGASAVATVGITETFLFVVYSVAMGVAMAVTAVVARFVGEKAPERAARAAGQALLLAVLASLPFSIAGLYYARDLLAWMGADAWTLAEGYRYTQWMLGGNAVILLLFALNAVFRGAGDAAVAMRVLWLANGLNLVLDPLLIFGLGPIPALGIEGAAIATNLGRGAAVVMQLYILLRGSPHLRTSIAVLRPDPSLLVLLVRTSVGGIGQTLVATTAWLFLMRILAELGSTAVAGATIAIRLLMFTLLPAWGLSNAAATLVGQNLGARREDRAEAAVWRIGWMAMAYTAIVSVLFFVWHDAWIGLFTEDPAVIAIGGEWLRILSYSYVVYGWWMVASQAYNGAGDTMTPTWINLVFFWLLQIPLCHLLAVPLQMHAPGVFWGVLVSETGAGLYTLWLFSRGGWKRFRPSPG